MTKKKVVNFFGKKVHPRRQNSGYAYAHYYLRAIVLELDEAVLFAFSSCVRVCDAMSVRAETEILLIRH